MATKTKTAVKKVVTKKPVVKDEKVVKSAVKVAAKAPMGKKAAKKIEEAVIPAPSVEKQEVIAKFQVKEGDTGSPEVQVALLTARIEKLVGHLKTNPSDNHSRRGLLGLVSKRRRLLNYLGKKDMKRFKDIEAKLGLGK